MLIDSAYFFLLLAEGLQNVNCYHILCSKSLPNNTQSYYHDEQAIFELFHFGHQLYAFEIDLLENFLSNIGVRKALHFYLLRSDCSL